MSRNMDPPRPARSTATSVALSPKIPSKRPHFPILMNMAALAGTLRHQLRFRQIIRMAVGLALAASAFFLLAGRSSELSGASIKLAHSNWRWVAIAVICEAFSFVSFAALQKTLLQSVGTLVRISPLLALTLATTAIASSLPGEPAFSSAYRFQQYRRRGADTAGASWVVVALLVVSAIGLSFLLLIGVAVAATSSSGYELRGALILSMAVILAAGAVLIRRDLLAALATAALRTLKRVSGHPSDRRLQRLNASIEELRSIRISWQEMGVTVALALLTWIFDALCLVSSFRIVHAGISWAALPLAYGVSQIAAVLPLLPGGLGLVEGSITAVLVVYGSPRVPTLAAVLAFRIIGFWLVIPLGWFAFATTAYVWRRSKKHPDRIPAPFEMKEATSMSRHKEGYPTAPGPRA